ncbi:MAG TPA: MBL fold metallo-hydrolase [Mycobacteriales bacterium]|jgi:glyoxylase-like metal-dependent hydrolase (beta-lactamase superfamily II)|nr:MBL fold metallo-hydrolase [Mycobacteriales bacterium]
MSNWFAVQRLREGVYLIGEPMHVNSYLIVGSERAILLDTGMGISDIRSAVDQITPLPVLVVNSHYHFDHVGGNHLFDDIAIHEQGAERLQIGPPPFWIPRYLAMVEELLAKYSVFRDIDQDWFQVIAPEMQMRPLPSGFDGSTWRTITSVPTKLLRDGDELDLGGRVLKVLHTPGHTPDCICLFDAQSRLLFTGDTIDTGPIYAQFEDSNVDEFVASTEKLMAYSDMVDVLLSAHGARYQSYPELISRVHAAFVLVSAGQATLFDTQDCFGTAAKEARFNDFSIIVRSALRTTRA